MPSHVSMPLLASRSSDALPLLRGQGGPIRRAGNWGSKRIRVGPCTLSRAWAVCLPAALLLLFLTATRRQSEPPSASDGTLPGSPRVPSRSMWRRSSRQTAAIEDDGTADLSAAAASSSDPVREKGNIGGMDSGGSSSDPSPGFDGTPPHEDQVQQASAAGSAAIQPLSHLVAAGPVAEGGATLGGNPQNPLQNALDIGVQQRSSGSGSTASTSGTSKPKLMLFVGCLSGRGYRHRRLAVREAWLKKAQAPGVSAAKFILSEDEQTEEVEREMEQHADIVFVAEKTTYESILHKVYFLFEYAVLMYDVAFILKTDDDSFVNVPWLVLALKNMCVTPGCTRERLYMGRMAKDSEVLLRPGHRWANTDFWNHTALRRYPKYAMGGGYVLSGDVASMLVDTQARMGLKFTPIEDAMVGAWLMPMALRHVDHKRFNTRADPCCFKPPEKKKNFHARPPLQLQATLKDNLCSDDPWLVLHKVETPVKMLFLGRRFAECEPASEEIVAHADAAAAAGTAVLSPSASLLADQEQ